MDSSNGANGADGSPNPMQISDRMPTKAAAESDDRLSRTVMIKNVSEKQRDFIELYVEDAKQGGGEYEDTIYDGKNQCLTVIFADAKGLKNIFHLCLDHLH